MTKAKASGGDLSAIANAVDAAGYEVFYVDTQYSQLYLSACAKDGQWVLSAVADFAKNCGSDSNDDDDDDENASKCPANERGPACSSDTDCTDLTDCLRCASSGYCTATPL
jgi:hypothetical protein